MSLVLVFIMLSKFIECISKCSLDNSSKDFKPHSPMIKCAYLDDIFLVCDQHGTDLKGNITAKEELGYGCVKFGGQKFHDVEVSRTFCRVLDGIECYGDRVFLTIKEYPCIKYNGHYFINTLIYSLLLGFLGMDRFCLGHTGTAVGKLLTFGGLGVWWIVDIVLLILGDLSPADDSSWVPYY